MLSRAAADGASGVHVEAYEDRTRVRYRIDGFLFDRLEVPRSLHLAVVSRLKIIARLDIAERLVRRMVIDGIDADAIRRTAAAAGMISLRQAGFRLVVRGDTTLEEVMAVVADQE